MHLPAGWTAKNIIGFLFCCVLLPGLLIWRVETGDNPDRTFAFFWGGWTAGGFSKGLYELIRARGAFRRLVFDEKRSKHSWWLVPLLVLMAPLMWASSDGEPWRWVYPLAPFACVAGSVRVPREGKEPADAATPTNLNLVVDTGDGRPHGGQGRGPSRSPLSPADPLT